MLAFLPRKQAEAVILTDAIERNAVEPRVLAGTVDLETAVLVVQVDPRVEAIDVEDVAVECDRGFHIES